MALACPALLGACGGGGGGEDVEGLLDRAFRHSVTSAELKIDASVTLDGLKGFERPVRLQATGPYVGGGRRPPKLDIDLNLGALGAGQNVQFGLLRTRDRAFVKFGGEFYEQSRREVRRANRELGTGRRGRGASLRDLGLSPRTWVVGARDEGDAKVAGVETHHVSGTLDPRSLLRDLNELVKRSGSVVGGSAAGAADPLSNQELNDVADSVRNPSFDVYVGKDDDVIRRLSAQLEVRVPQKDRARAGGIKGGAVRFSIEFGDLGGRQAIEAPAKARPISDLTKQLGGLTALAGVGALGDDATGGRDAGGKPARKGAARGTKPDARSPGGADGGGGGVEAFQRYSECLDKAGPDDTKALSRCANLLH